MNLQAFQEMIPEKKNLRIWSPRYNFSFFGPLSIQMWYTIVDLWGLSFPDSHRLFSLFQPLSFSPWLPFHSFLWGTVWMCPLHVSGEARWKGGEVSIALTRSVRTHPSFGCTLASQPLLSPSSSAPCCDAMQTFLHASWIRQTRRCLPFSWLSDC